MKKLKQALSLSLALILSLALALPAASAAGVEDYQYIKFSNKSIGRTQLTIVSDSMGLPTTFLVWIFPDGTTYTITVPDGGSLHYDRRINYDSTDGFKGIGNTTGTFAAFSDFDYSTHTEINIRKTDTRDMDYYDNATLTRWTVYNSVKYINDFPSEAGEIIEEVYFCTQSALEQFVAAGATSVMQPTEQPSTPTQPEQPAGPQVSDWAKDQAAKAAANGLVADGMGNDYRVNITRAQFAATAVKLYEAMSGQTAPAAGDGVFVDTSAPAVIQAAALGFVNGVGDGKFAPDDLVTREQAAVMLSRVYTKLGGNIPGVTATSFADNGSVSDWAKDSVAFMADKGIVNGVGDNNFAPQGNASIEQALAIALRMFENLK